MINKARLEKLEETVKHLKGQARTQIGDIFSVSEKIREPPTSYVDLYRIWKKSWIIRSVTSRITQEVTRPKWYFKPLFTYKCDKCDITWDYKPKDEVCTECGGKVRKPDRKQLKDIKELLKKPNSIYSFGDILRRIIKDGLICDDWFIFVNKNKFGYPKELYVEDVRFMKIVCDNRGLFSGEFFCPNCEGQPTYGEELKNCPKCNTELVQTAYVQKISGAVTARFGVDEIIHSNLFAVGTRLYGTSNLLALNVIIANMLMIDNYQYDVYMNQRVPKHAFNFPKMGDGALERLKAMVKAELKKNPTSSLWLNSPEPLQFIKVMESLVDLETIKFNEFYMKAVCYVYGVSPKFIGIETPGKLGKETTESEASVFTIEEIQHQIAESINDRLLPMFVDPEITDWELAFYPPRGEDEKKDAEIEWLEAQRIARLTEVGYKFELTPEGKYSPIESKEPEREIESKSLERKEVLEKRVQLLKPYTADYAKDLDEINLKMYDQVNKILTSYSNSLKKQDFDERVKEEIMRQIMSELNITKEEAQNLARERLEFFGKEGFRYTADEYGVGITFGTDDLEAILYFYDEYTLPAFENTFSSYRDKIGSIFDQGVKENWNWEKVSREIRNAIDPNKENYGKYMFDRIARTEVARYVTEGHLRGYKKMGIETMEWVTASNPCPDCAALEGHRFPIDEISGMLPLHPSCLCALIPVGRG